MTVQAAATALVRPLRAYRGDAATGAAAGSLAALAFGHFGFGARGVVAGFVVSVLTILSRIDLERRVLPNRIVLPAAGVVLAAQVAMFPDRALEWVIAPVGASLLLLLPLLVYPGGMGMGDVKLALLLGAALGYAVFTALLVGFVLVLPAALYLVARSGQAARGAAIPFGPFLAAGAVVALFAA
ncbi:MAG TPA: A24 family peptidase [Gaiellaceae bacterium]|nr:A24 family peptidase [Gaiellaceae bacterium]